MNFVYTFNIITNIRRTTKMLRSWIYDYFASVIKLHDSYHISSVFNIITPDTFSKGQFLYSSLFILRNGSIRPIIGLYSRKLNYSFFFFVFLGFSETSGSSTSSTASFFVFFAFLGAASVSSVTSMTSATSLISSGSSSGVSCFSVS